MENFDEFDDFRSPGDAQVSEPISNILAKEQSELEEWKADFDEQLLMSDNPDDELREIVVGYIQGVGDVNEVYYCDYNNKRGVALNAWSFTGDEDNSTIDLFLTVYVDPESGDKISYSEIDKKLTWLQRFYEQSKSGSMLTSLANEKSDVFEVAELINKTDNINRLRLFIITNAILSKDKDKSDTELEDGTTCEYHIWDAKRIMQQDNIISGKNPIVVDLEGDYNTTLKCIQMPDVSKHVKCYLTIIPGIILSQVYHKYHQQILEMNVRTFLQFKGASNKGIRATLIGHKATAAEQKKGITDRDPEPDMFFAYNNGISATASDVCIDENTGDITKIKGWQIVNGGQTTAAISAVMNMDKVDLLSLASVHVPMKISVIKDPEQTSEIVPKISRYANTQSAVKKSDFNINEKFLVELEQKSREEWVLLSNGKPTSKWFFERTRGQYLDKAKRNRTPKAEREFYAEYPKEQMFDKTLLSKAMMSWAQNPSLVCKGGENCYTAFFEKMKRDAVKFDTTTYRRTIAKLILFKAIDALYGKDGIALAGYKSNAVAYTMAYLSLKSNKSIDLDAIWDEQFVMSPIVYNDLTISIYSIYAKLVCGVNTISYKIKESYVDNNGRRRNRFIPKGIISDELDKLRNTKLFRILMHVKSVQSFIYQHLITVNEGENTNEWTKKPICWDVLKTKLQEKGAEFQVPASLCSEKGDQDVEVTEGQMKAITEVKEIGADVWFSINKWSKENYRMLTPKEQAFMGQLGFRVARGYAVSYKQAKWALDILDKARDKGWCE